MTFHPDNFPTVSAAHQHGAARPCEICALGGGLSATMRMATTNAGSSDPVDRFNKQTSEDLLVDAAIAAIENIRILDNLPASMRLMEHIAETAGYRLAQQDPPSHVTELMLIGARASALADLLRERT